jgi:branched-chain amino acid aminotransferase
MTALPVSIDGAIVAAGEARVPALDLGFTQGLSAFDTLLAEDGRAHFVERHQARLRATCAFLAIDVPAQTLLHERLAQYLARLPRTPLAVRTTVTRGSAGSPSATVLAARAFEPAPASGVLLVVEERFTLAGDALDQHKTSNRARHHLAREAARELGAFDALLSNARGELVDATSANVWARIDGTLVTPPLGSGALDGVVRAVLLEDLARAGERVHERSLARADLARADEVFLTSSLHRVAGVRAIRGLVADLPGPAGPSARRALDLVREAERRAR